MRTIHGSEKAVLISRDNAASSQGEAGIGEGLALLLGTLLVLAVISLCCHPLGARDTDKRKDRSSRPPSDR